MTLKEKIREKASRAKIAAGKIKKLSATEKNGILLAIASALEKKEKEILEANRKDLNLAREKKCSFAFIERLTLTKERIKNMVDGLRKVASLPDPVGETMGEIIRYNGLRIEKVRVPLGVIGVIYESRPNVTCDASGLCLKSGNAVLLRGGSFAFNSNFLLVKIMIEAALPKGLPEDSIQFIETTEREAIGELICLDEFIDVIIPRGGEEMIKHIKSNASVPVITHGKGLCHTYVDKEANPEQAQKICFNAKVQRPGVCNAMETLLVHKEIAKEFLPKMIKIFKEADVELRGCTKTKTIFPSLKEATAEDWETEYLSLTLSIKIVDSLNEAIEHINQYGSQHSDAIITENKERAEQFLSWVDSASVYWNASTRFSDGEEFGLGAEIGISTQKLHARGPMGLKGLTSYKFLIYGNGQIRT
ncbi:glutamate-5-semialdehyde dehydrogenase [bacterium]|nr:glutamate-5-semialdehyde dehydrogenase [bacterium]